jgi:hypothetical protein
VKHAGLAFLLLAALGASAQTDTVVANAFPECLVIPDGLRQYGYATGTINGANVIAAAFSNGEFGAVVILTPAGAPIATIAPDNLLGVRPEVALTDIDGDGQPEIVVTMNQPRGLPATWIYRFASDRLTILGPLRDGAKLPETDLADAQFLRTDATKRLSVLDRHSARWCDDDGTEHDTETTTIYTWNGTGFNGGQPVDLVTTAQRGSGAPQPITTTFAVSAVPTSRTLLLINGDAAGEHLASSVSVLLNGDEVIGEKNLNQTIAAIRVPVTLNQLTNQITVTVKSDPGANVTVLVLP